MKSTLLLSLFCALPVLTSPAFAQGKPLTGTLTFARPLVDLLKDPDHKMSFNGTACKANVNEINSGSYPSTVVLFENFGPREFKAYPLRRTLRFTFEGHAIDCYSVQRLGSDGMGHLQVLINTPAEIVRNMNAFGITFEADEQAQGK